MTPHSQPCSFKIFRVIYFTILLFIFQITTTLAAKDKSLRLVASPLNLQSNTIQIVGTLHCGSLICDRVKYFRLKASTHRHVKVNSLKFGVCGPEPWTTLSSKYYPISPTTSNDFAYNFLDTEQTPVNPTTTPFVAELQVDSAAFDGYTLGDSLIFGMSVADSTNIFEISDSVIYSTLSTVSDTTPNGLIQLTQRYFPQQNPQQNIDSFFSSSIPSILQQNSSWSNIELNDDTTNDFQWITTIETKIKYPTIPTHLNMTFFGQYLIQLPADVDSIEINGYASRWKIAKNRYSISIALPAPLQQELQFPQKIIIRFPGVILRTKLDIFSCNVNGNEKLTIQPHFIFSLYTESTDEEAQKIHFVMDLQGSDAVSTLPTRFVPPEIAIYSFYEPGNKNFLFLVNAMDFAGLQTNIDKSESLSMVISTGVFSDTSIFKQNAVYTSRFDLVNPAAKFVSKSQHLAPKSSSFAIQLPDDLKLNSTNDFPKIIYHTQYGQLVNEATEISKELPFQSLLSISSTIKGDTIAQNILIKNPIFTYDAIPLESMSAAVSTNKQLSSAGSIRIIFRSLNRHRQFNSQPTNLILSLPLPNTAFSVTNALCTWQFTSTLNSFKYEANIESSWYISPPTTSSHFEWPATELVPIKRLIFQFPQDLATNPFSTPDGDALLVCNGIEIQRFTSSDQFVRDGANFPYKCNGSSMKFKNRTLPPQTLSPQKFSQKLDVFYDENTLANKNVNLLSDNTSDEEIDYAFILTTQFTTVDSQDVYSVYQTSIINRFDRHVNVESIDLDLARVLKNIITIAVPVILLGIAAFGIYQLIHYLRNRGKTEDPLILDDESSLNQEPLSETLLSSSGSV